MPAFVLLFFIGVVLLFFLLSFIYEPLGKLAKHIFGDALNIINDKNESKEEREDKKE